MNAPFSKRFLERLECSVVNEGDGLHVISFSPMRAGLAYIHCLIDGQYVGGEPISVEIHPDIIDTSQCVLRMRKVSKILAGSSIAGQLLAFDRFGNPVSGYPFVTDILHVDSNRTTTAEVSPLMKSSIPFFWLVV